MSNPLIITNAVIPGHESLGPQDVLCRGGVIGRVAPTDPSVVYPPEYERLDARGAYIAPAFVDLHTHMREPGQEYKEDVATASRAAAAGGYTAVVSMPNTAPVTDNPDTVGYVLRRARELGLVQVLPAAAVTVGSLGRELCDFDALAAAGARAFTDDGKPVWDPAVMLQALEAAARLGLPILSHSEEPRLAGALFASEAAAIARDIVLAEQAARDTGLEVRLHIMHVSCAQSVRIIRDGKARIRQYGVPVRLTCETCPHYIALTEAELSRSGANAKINPPLRTEADRQELIAALADGTIDCISTDHAPHSPEDKHIADGGISAALSGIIGLQTAFSVCYTALVKPGVLPLGRLLALMSHEPARIIGLPERARTSRSECAITPGAPADLVLFDTEPHTYTREEILSKSANTPFLGVPLDGRVLRTIREGKVIELRA